MGSTLNSTYNEVTFNKKSAITKENLCTKYMPFTYKYIALNKKLPIMKQNLSIFFFVIGRVECIRGGTEAPPVWLTYLEKTLFLGKLTTWGCLSHPLYSPNTPFLHIYSAIFGMYQCFISLTFSLGPDEGATVWCLQKLVCDFNVILLCFSNQLFN